MLCLLSLKVQAKNIIFSVRLWTLLLPPAQTEQGCSVSSSPDVLVFSHEKTQRQVAFSGVPQPTLTWSPTDLSLFAISTLLPRL